MEIVEDIVFQRWVNIGGMAVQLVLSNFARHNFSLCIINGKDIRISHLL